MKEEYFYFCEISSTSNDSALLQRGTQLNEGGTKHMINVLFLYAKNLRLIKVCAYIHIYKWCMQRASLLLNCCAAYSLEGSFLHKMFVVKFLSEWKLMGMDQSRSLPVICY